MRLILNLIGIVIPLCMAASFERADGDSSDEELDAALEAVLKETAVSSSSPQPLEPATISALPAYGPISADSPFFNRGRRGVMNVGNTCHLNAALQVLLHSRQLRELVLPIASAPLPETGADVLAARVVNAFARLMDAMWSDSDVARSNTPVNPTEVYQAIRAFQGAGFAAIGQMDDSQTGTIALLDALKSVDAPIALAARALTQSTLIKTLTCQTCSAPRGRREPLTTAEIPLGVGKAPITLQESIRAYLATEIIDDVRCDTCAANRRTSMENMLEPAPLMVFNIKRLGWNPYTFEPQRSGSWIHYPATFDMAEYVPGAAGEYRLIGIVHHVSNHYIADYLHPEDGRWYRTDDRSVIPFYNYLRPESGEPHMSGPSQTSLVYERV